jgi:hypothetical protein
VDVRAGLQPREDADFKGRLSPFTLNILKFFSIRFRDGITYHRQTHGPGSLSAPVRAGDVQFGDELQFLQALESFLASGDPNNGPFTRVLLDQPGIEAGIVFGIPVITLGVTFTNINLYGSVLLPFDDRQAMLRFSLGTLDSPFMISAGIYGGSGYFGFRASGAGIQAFSSSFQFGGVASIGYGPLQGTAYVTTGAYITQTQTSSAFGAIFSAGFTAHIACFGVSAAFTLLLVKTDNGVAGTATLTFRFSVGFFSVAYSVGVQRSMGNGFQGADRSAAEIVAPQRVLFADASGTLPTLGMVQAAQIITTAPVPDHAWNRYAAQFDASFRPA